MPWADAGFRIRQRYLWDGLHEIPAAGLAPSPAPRRHSPRPAGCPGRRGAQGLL